MGYQRRERRSGQDRRQPVFTVLPDSISWTEQKVQYAIRYFFGLLGLIYFNFIFGYQSDWLTLKQMSLALVVYLGLVAFFHLHAYRYPHKRWRLRVMMWIDVIFVSLAVLNDPFMVPLTSMVYIVICLGNGMRYGMRFFTETLISCFFTAMIVLSLRYTGGLSDISGGVIFLNLFGGIILFYAYFLMGRIEATRRSLEQSSRIDPLTGLYNRGALFEVAEIMLANLNRHGGSMVIMFADLDKFKAVNDTYGHVEGDKVLRVFAGLLQQQIRKTDIAARYGGDEFVLLLDNSTIASAQQVARRIQNEMDSWIQREEIELSVTIGIGEAPRHGMELETLLRRVDQAMYLSKRQHTSGGICVVNDADNEGSELADGVEV